MNNIDLVIIGGGPAGLAAAVAARKAGVENLLILERDSELGGILNQCIHNGFGLHTFKEELTGPEYAARFIAQAEELQIPYKLNTMVLDLAADKTVTAMNKTDGLFQLHPKAVILAMGCRERPRGALNIPGYRPAGIYTAGTAQRLVNMEGYLPGRKVVILGSGDIGLIMARRMTLEGAQVQVVAELMPYSGGLKRNIVQCLDDFGIPLKLSHTVVDIQGKERVEGITLARVENGKPVPGTEEHYDCDTLLLSCGLLPENELSRAAGVALSPITSGPLVNESLETSIPGVYAIGDVSSPVQLAHVAAAQGAACVEHMAGLSAGVCMDAVPSCIYCRPEIAAVGLTEAEAKERGIPVKTGKCVMGGNARTVIADPGRCFMKVTAHAETGAILGAQLMCPNASDIIGQLGQAIANGMTPGQLLAAMRPHPTYEEALSEALESLAGKL